MRNKKAAIELSTTAIIILILAIVMLGLALGFIRGMFGKVQTQFEEQIAAEPEPPEPSGAEPITLSRETILTNAGDNEVLKVAFYNPTGSILLDVNPSTGLVDNCVAISEATANDKSVSQGESKEFNVLITIESGGNFSTGTYLCEIEIDDYQKDFIIKVTK